MNPPLARDPVSVYAQSVIAGEVVAGELVRHACQRHLDDLQSGKSRGLRFDLKAAEKAIKFFALLHHSKGEWAGQSFELQPWQQFVVGSVFGWKRADGRRRYTVAHVEVARKNGKSTLAAGIGLYLFLLDGEPGAEVYTVATKRDQAKLTHEESKRMVKASPHLARRVTVYRDNLNVPATSSKYEPICSEGDSLDGLNPSGVIADELHAWKQRLLWDVMETATGARRQPLFLVTTTAGHDRKGIWWERRELCVKMLRGLVENDSLFAYIATLDEGDEWDDESVWAKANPCLGVTVRVEELREKAREAKDVPGKQNPFKRLRLNVPTDQADLWLNMDHWDACGKVDFSETDLQGRRCFSGLDLSATTDLSSLCHVFPPEAEQEPWKAVWRFWLPGDDLHERAKRDGVPYQLWAQQGWLTLTDGPVIDYDVIERQVLADAQRFRIESLAFDRYLANQLTTRLLDHHGLPVVGFGQGYLSMSGPSKELEKLVVGHTLAHGNNPVARWMAGCVSVRVDPAGNVKPDKSTSTSRIDGIVALVMALGRAMVAEVVSDGGYEVW